MKNIHTLILPTRKGFGVFEIDDKGNKYDTMRSFVSIEDAEKFRQALVKGDARYCPECEQYEEK